ncbi:hypothetical protein CROQUDRAFT_662379 [Cronartium quercuum f. sp. fusiforme G11]|uniref:Uncharacterized protein n=1 Tax=Cronartium quercuum f. sp. fusiforme G11 TaxID=708437 RepID=A0A9P6NF99_9BASI|nr:hypothetical protein CROQUDRAFT_662379 [Cronartium quercuum f. sp. fusiforme G11]
MILISSTAFSRLTFLGYLLVVVHQTLAQIPRIQLHYSTLPPTKSDSEDLKPARPLQSNWVKPQLESQAQTSDSESRADLRTLPSYLPPRSRTNRWTSLGSIEPKKPNKHKPVACDPSASPIWSPDPNINLDVPTSTARSVVSGSSNLPPSPTRSLQTACSRGPPTSSYSKPSHQQTAALRRWFAGLMRLIIT